MLYAYTQTIHLKLYCDYRGALFIDARGDYKGGSTQLLHFLGTPVETSRFFDMKITAYCVVVRQGSCVYWLINVWKWRSVA
jgi:hypothetical protein